MKKFLWAVSEESHQMDGCTRTSPSEGAIDRFISLCIYNHLLSQVSPWLHFLAENNYDVIKYSLKTVWHSKVIIYLVIRWTDSVYLPKWYTLVSFVIKQFDESHSHIITRAIQRLILNISILPQLHTLLSLSNPRELAILL